ALVTEGALAGDRAPSPNSPGGGAGPVAHTRRERRSDADHAHRAPSCRPRAGALGGGDPLPRTPKRACERASPLAGRRRARGQERATPMTERDEPHPFVTTCR